MMLTATGHWIDAHAQVVLTSEAPQGYSHHPHIEKEHNNSEKQKQTQREEKQTE